MPLRAAKQYCAASRSGISRGAWPRGAPPAYRQFLSPIKRSRRRLPSLRGCSSARASSSKILSFVVAPDTPERREILAIAKNYRNPNDWSGEPEKTKSLAKEPDTHEFDSAGGGITEEFDYEIMFKYTSHFVHSTVGALEGHLTERGDTFKIRARWHPYRKARLAVFNVLATTSKIFISGFRALRHDQPDEILQEIFVKMRSH